MDMIHMESPRWTPRARPPGTSGPTLERVRAVRTQTVTLLAGLNVEDLLAASLPTASPLKWHLAHTSWFFERFVLPRMAGGWMQAEGWDALFNSYYETLGPTLPRARRALLTRPAYAEVLTRRREVDDALELLLETGPDAATLELLELGLQHEQQHQELMLMDLKHLFYTHPWRPRYRRGKPAAAAGAASPELAFVAHTGGIVEIGADTESGFAYDNERPRHRVLQEAFLLANRPVTNGEYRAFVEAGGYRDPRLWVADGWTAIAREGWERPLYWDADLVHEFSLLGTRRIDAQAPVCHVSWYEADAYARWAGARLPTEAEWEVFGAQAATTGAVALQTGQGEPEPVVAGAGRVHGLLGNVWEWTASPYVGYPGYKPVEGALGEYNAKFMSGQMVLRGGCCATPLEQVRPTYRNFFYPADRWQFGGIRLAKDL